MEDNRLGGIKSQILFHLPSSELYPNQNLNKEDIRLTTPFPTLCGEAVEYLVQTSEGIMVLSNYRFYFQFIGQNTFYNIPLGLIEKVEVEVQINLRITCKHARTFRIIFSMSDQCLDWLHRIEKAITPPKHKDDVFAFKHFVRANVEQGEEVSFKFRNYSFASPEKNFKNEVNRMKFDTKYGGAWRISSVNAEYKLCNSYPRYLITPASINDSVLQNASKFRTSRRIPSVVWRHPVSGAVIARCSQPEVGWLGWRSSADEELLKAITDACAKSKPAGSNSENKLLVLDARSYTAAVVNRVRGGGCECSEYYRNCEIKFMSLANIHLVRKSFDALKGICAMPIDQPGWYDVLEGTRWLHYISGLLKAAVTVARTVEQQARPVLVHCSDGWDRTPQIVSLAELLLDPYYRTIEGFQILVEREWLDFGHKFSDRGHLFEDTTERSPIFIQWLDAIQNLIRQFPCAFEFSTVYLVKLALHIHSNLFGTFLCNTSAERSKLGIHSRTFSIWPFLKDPKFRNYLFSSSQDQVLWPNCHVRYLDMWRELYLELDKNFSVITPSFPLKNIGEIFNNDMVHCSGFNKPQHNHQGRNNDNVRTISNCNDNSLFNENRNIANENATMDSNNSTNNKDNNEQFYSNQGRKPEIKLSGNEDKLTNHTNQSDVPLFSRTHAVFPQLDPIDGLATFEDEVQIRLQEIVRQHESKLLTLEKELYSTRTALLQQGCHQCSQHGECGSDEPAVAEKSQDDSSSICDTEGSWVAIDEQIFNLWVPDEVISHCMSCSSEFWFGCRKHHCRKCGKIFCAECSKYAVALPEEQLNHPVRVCESCYNTSVLEKSETLAETNETHT